jgi:hypothetical protein
MAVNVDSVRQRDIMRIASANDPFGFRMNSMQKSRGMCCANSIHVRRQNRVSTIVREITRAYFMAEPAKPTIAFDGSAVRES